jgi:hypothetical protein
MLVTWGIGGAIIYFCFSTVRDKLNLRNEIIMIESEFSEALYQLGSRLHTGAPFENVIKEVTPKIKNLKISSFFSIIIYNMETFGMTLEQSIFDPVSGAINSYPSTLIEAIMKTVADIQVKGGFAIMSKIMISISTYLKNIKSVEEDLQDMMSEVTSSLHIQAILLAPLTAGIVVALAAIIMDMMVIFGGATEPLYSELKGYGTAGDMGGNILTGFINIDKMIPIHIFQIMVGVYMIEIVVQMTMFLSIIENGEENILKRLLIGQRLLMSIIIYSIVMILVYSGFNAMLPPMGMMP